MVTITMLILLVSVPLFSYTITPIIHTRVTLAVLISAAVLCVSSINYYDSTNYTLFNNTFVVNNYTLYIDVLLYSSSALILTGWSTTGKGWSSLRVPEYALLVLFTTLGASMLISSNDLVSMVLSLEVQSFSLYVLATMYRYSESSTAAGLKYFLLGGFSSSMIILGTGIIYFDSGLTNLSDLFMLYESTVYSTSYLLGMTFVGLGLLFKVAAVPLHFWSPDVYDGTPTIITTWLIVVPKISLFAMLYNLTHTGSFMWQLFLLVSAVLSLVTGAVLGLAQTRIKRLLTYSTINHVGFLLLAAAMNTFEGDISLIFYITQYTLSNTTLFLILLAIGYSHGGRRNPDIVEIEQLSGLANRSPMLALCMTLILLSMAGIPPMLGFFGKMNVLYATISTGSYFVSIVAVLSSVVSCYYYLSIIRVMYFPTVASTPTTSTAIITRVHSAMIALGVVVSTGYLLYPNLLLNACTTLAVLTG